ncbi:MAG: hypothetical protein LC099_08325 [Anaerolineales bacterium]|nr:hypothetical protein [Anaerolineales bacterium]
MRIDKKVFLLILILISACAPKADSPAPAPTDSLAPTSTAEPTSAPQPTPTLEATATPAPLLERPQYALDVTLDYDAHALRVDETIYYPNHSGSPLNELVLAIVPNLWEGGFSLTAISVGGEAAANYALDGQRLDLALPAALPAGGVVEIKIQYALTLPFAEQEDPNVARPRIYGYTSRQINLVNWYPFVVPYVNGEWLLHDAWYYGENLVYDAADYEVNLRFADSANAPVVAASGIAEAQPDGATRYAIESARAFALSASREFQSASLQVGDATLTSYYFGLYQEAGQAALQTTAQALQIFSAKFGAYPHKSLAIVMGDFNDGMEYSAFYYLSKDFYNLYDGTPANYLTFVAAHETAHQWWFEQVGNDQALQPWLDEALSTYSERLYYENVSPDLVSWWQTYRMDFYNPSGFADIPIYEGQGFRPYTNAVYFQGARFLDALRQRIGDEAFFAFLQDYLNQKRGQIATADDFFRLLRTHTNTDYSDLVAQYYRGAYP